MFKELLHHGLTTVLQAGVKTTTETTGKTIEELAPMLDDIDGEITALCRNIIRSHGITENNEINTIINLCYVYTCHRFLFGGNNKEEDK